MKAVGLAAILALGVPLGAQNTWPFLPQGAWKLDTSKAREGILWDTRVIRLTPLRREDTYRFRILPGAKPHADLDIPGSGLLMGRYLPPQGDPIPLGRGDFQPGDRPGTRRPTQLMGDGFLDLQIREQALPLGLVDRNGDQIMDWFPCPQLHQRLPLGGPQPTRELFLILGAQSGFTALEGNADPYLKQEATDGEGFMTLLQGIPAANAPGALTLHWFDLPPALTRTRQNPAQFWNEAILLLRKAYLEQPTGGLFWSRKRKAFLEGLPSDPVQAAQTILDRIRTRLTLLDVSLEDLMENPEAYVDVPGPTKLGEMVDKDMTTPPGRFQLAHRLFADAGLRPHLKFLVDPAVGEFRMDVPSLFQITHVLLGVPRPDGTLSWFDPRTVSPAPEALAKAPGLQVVSQGWTLKSPVPIP